MVIDDIESLNASRSQEREREKKSKENGWQHYSGVWLQRQAHGRTNGWTDGIRIDRRTDKQTLALATRSLARTLSNCRWSGERCGHFSFREHAWYCQMSCNVHQLAKPSQATSQPSQQPACEKERKPANSLVLKKVASRPPLLGPPIDIRARSGNVSTSVSVTEYSFLKLGLLLSGAWRWCWCSVTKRFHVFWLPRNTWKVANKLTCCR